MNISQPQLSTHAAGGQDVAQVTQQAVAHISCGVRHATQCHAQCHAGGGPLHALAHGSKLGRTQAGTSPENLQRQARIAQRAAHVNVVANPGRAAAQSLVFGHLAKHGNANVQRPGRGVAAHQRTTVLIGQCEQPARKPRQPGFVGSGQRQRQRKRQWLCAHGRQVAQVDGQRLVPQCLGRYRGQKVSSLHQHVG